MDLERIVRKLLYVINDFDTSELIGDDDPTLEVFATGTESDNASYFEEVVTKTYGLSCDISVFWRINDTFNDFRTSELEEGTTSEFLDDFDITWEPTNAETVKTDEVKIAISTIPGKTLKGDYAFNIQISEDGKTWEDYDMLTFSAGNADTNDSPDEEDDELIPISSSGSSCNFGLSSIGLGFVLIAMIMKKR